jgi:hypothetical protein
MINNINSIRELIYHDIINNPKVLHYNKGTISVGVLDEPKGICLFMSTYK